MFLIFYIDPKAAIQAPNIIITNTTAVIASIPIEAKTVIPKALNLLKNNDVMAPAIAAINIGGKK